MALSKAVVLAMLATTLAAASAAQSESEPPAAPVESVQTLPADEIPAPSPVPQETDPPPPESQEKETAPRETELLFSRMSRGLPGTTLEPREEESTAGAEQPGRPGVVNRPLETPAQKDSLLSQPSVPAFSSGKYFLAPVDAPPGFTGKSSVLSEEVQTGPNFVPRPDRWRIGFPEWDRYGKGHPCGDDYPYKPGHWWDPYNQNVLKGDYPIIGQHTFFVLSASLFSVVEPRLIPTATTPFESTSRAFEEQFFGSPNQYSNLNFLSLGLDLFHGDGSFRPVDWRVKLTPVFNVNYLAVDELAVVNPDVTRGTTRIRDWFALNEWFAETKLADLSPDYDFVSLRAGAQPFTSDFRGFIFSDINRGVRLFGTQNANRQQFNLVYFRQLEKETNSGLNTFHDRHQDVVMANYYIQDFVFPGYTTQFNAVYNHDAPTFKFDNNNVLVRPDPVGVFQPHGLDVVYLGWTGEGHINRLNISHAFYWALGRDSLNPLANQAQDISAQMAALELSYDRDWMRFRTSFFWASGDENINNRHATGFDAIFDNPNFAGGEFSYWQRQSIRLFGVNLVNRGSLLPDLRSSKIQGQSNFVNPGLYLANAGVDFDVTPKWRVITNANFLWFDSVNVLRQFVFQEQINQYIGADLSMGVEYRPLLSNNIILKAGVSTLIPGRGFSDLFDNLNGHVNPLFAAFAEIALNF
jgi:hypothetical protein